MSAYALRSGQPAMARQACRIAAPAPLAAETESGFGRLFVPALLAVLLATGCLGYESWMAQEPPSVVAGLR
jgi:hypothetical protein